MTVLPTELAHPTAIQQIKDLRTTDPNWAGYSNRPKKISAEAWDTFEAWVTQYLPTLRTKAYLYITPDGEIQIEWMFHRRDASLLVEPVSMSGYWHVLELDILEEESKPLDLAVDHQWLCERLQALDAAVHT